MKKNIVSRKNCMCCNVGETFRVQSVCNEADVFIFSLIKTLVKHLRSKNVLQLAISLHFATLFYQHATTTSSSANC